MVQVDEHKERCVNYTTALIKYKGMHCRHSELRSVVNVDQSFLLFLELFKYADLTVFIPVLNSYIIYCFWWIKHIYYYTAKTYLYSWLLQNVMTPICPVCITLESSGVFSNIMLDVISFYFRHDWWGNWPMST